MEHESDDNTNCNLRPWYTYQRINKGTGGLGNKRASGDYQNIYNIENVQNTDKSHWDLRILAVTLTQVKNHLLTHVWKSLKE